MMKIFDEQGKELTENDVDLTRGHLVETTRIRLDAEPVDNVKKFAYEDGDYEPILLYVCPVESDWLQRRIDSYKRQLADTDYCIIKIAEGAATKEEYADVIAQRAEWRAAVNELEAGLAALKEEKA